MFKWVESLEDALFTGSRDLGPPWGAVLRAARYPAALIRDWLQGGISDRAMSLAYTTLLSIVPLLVLFVIFQRHIVRSIVVTGLK